MKVDVRTTDDVVAIIRRATELSRELTDAEVLRGIYIQLVALSATLGLQIKQVQESLDGCLTTRVVEEH